MKIIIADNDGTIIVTHTAAWPNSPTGAQADKAAQVAMHEFALEQCEECFTWCRPGDLTIVAVKEDEDGGGLIMCDECLQESSV